MRSSAIALLFLFSCCLVGADNVTLDSSSFVNSTGFYVGGRFNTTAPSPLSIAVFVDGTAIGNPTLTGIPASAGNWSTYVNPAGFGVGPHTIDVQLLSGATTLATTSGVVVYDTVSPHVYAAFPNQYFSENSYGVSVYYYADENQALFVPGLTNVPVMPTGFLAGTPTNIKALTVSLSGNLDGTLETLSFGAGAPGGTTINAYNTTTRTLSVTSAGISPNSLSSLLQSLRYNNSQTIPSPGVRTISVYATDINNLVSDQASATVTVSKGTPEVALSGNSAAPNSTASYNQGAGAQAIVASAAIDAQTPAWVPGPYNSGGPPYYNPAWLYVMNGSGSISDYRGQVIDRLDITLANTSPGTPALQASEALTFTLPTEYAYQYDIGNFLIYDGFYDSTLASQSKGPYPMYSVRAKLIASTTSSKTWRVSVSQDPTYQFATLKISPVPTIPMPVGMAQSILRSMTYANNDTNPSGNGVSRRITVTATNATTSPTSQTSVARTCDITIVPTNSAPTCAYSGGGFTVDQGSALVPASVSVTGFTISDPDGNNNGAPGSPAPGNPETLTVQAISGTLTYSGSLANVSVLSGNGTSTLVLRGPVNGSGGTLTQVFSGNRITYAPAVGFSGADTIRVTLDDNGNSSTSQIQGSLLAQSALDTASATVTKVNQPPAIQSPASRNAVSAQPQVIPGIIISDPDLASTATVQARLTAGNGTLTLASTTGLSFSFSDADGTGAGTGTDDTTVVCRGSITNLNAALAGLSYRSTTNYYGNDTVTLQINDLGGSGVRRATYLTGSVSAGGSAAALVTSAGITMAVSFVNAKPTVATNSGVTVPIGSTVALTGGTYVASTNYPPAVSRLPVSYTAPLPSGCGTSATGGSMLVAQDVETKDATKLTYTVRLPVTQGTLRRQRPSQSAVDLTAGGIFTQDDLNRGYVSYIHNGALSGNDGFVFDVTDDNATTAPTSAPGGQVNGVGTTQIFNLTIDRTKPIVILNGVTSATFLEPAGSGTPVPVLIDNDPLTRVVNATDTTNLVLANLTGQLTVSVSIPVQLGVAAGSVSSDPLDTISILDQAPLTLNGTQVLYSGTPIGSYSGGAGTPLVVALGGTIPIQVAAVSELVRHLQFTNPGRNPSGSVRQISVTVQNGAGQSSVVSTKAVNVVPWNDAPTITPPSAILATVVGLPLTGSVIASDPDGAPSYAVTGSPPTHGAVTIDAATGSFTYTPAATDANSPGGLLNDQFEITVSDAGIPSDPTVKTAIQTYQVRITDLGAVAPTFSSNPPMETVVGDVLTYSPTVSTAGMASPSLRYVLVSPNPGVSPALAFDPTTGTMTWPAGWTLSPAAVADSYQQLGLLVVDQTTSTSAYQPILLKIILTAHASN